ICSGTYEAFHDGRHAVPHGDVHERAAVDHAVDRSSSRRHVLDDRRASIQQCDEERFEEQFFIIRFGKRRQESRRKEGAPASME
ncbi:MAG TPA: hypothetical protein VGC44_08845, partial [Longimicrobiales bacterium]